MNFLKFLISKSLLKQMFIAVLLFFVLVFGFKYWLGYITNHDQKIQVPNLSKVPLADAQQKLNAIHLDFIVIDSGSYNPNLPKQSVIDQSPSAGAFVKEKRKIYLTLNPSKYRDVAIPDVLGLTKRQAITQLRSIGFKIGKNFKYVQDIGKNVVRGMYYQNSKVTPDQKLPLNSEITLVLGNGRRN